MKPFANLALKYSKSSFAAELGRLQHGARSATRVIDRYFQPTWRSAANPSAAVAAVDGRDRQADGRTSDRYIDPAPHTMRAASLNAARDIYFISHFYFIL